MLELADYDIKIHHLKGSANGQANALSRQPNFDQGEGDNEGMVVLPDTLFARSAKLEDGEKQNEGIICLWVDPHQLKKVDGIWQKDRGVVVTASPLTQKSLSMIITTYPYTATQGSARLQIWSRGGTGGHDFDRM